MTRIYAWTLMILTLTALVACDDGASAAEEGPDAAPVDAGIDYVPFGAEIAALPGTATPDPTSFAPLDVGATWRYRKQTAQWQMPPAVTQGAEVTIVAGATDDERVRRTTVRFDLSTDEGPVPIEQIVEEVLQVTPGAAPGAGANVHLKALRITDVALDDGRPINRVERSYEPPYELIADTHGLGNTGNLLDQPMIQLTETITVGDGEPRTNMGLVRVRVETDRSAKTLPIEGNYRSKVYAVQVFDDFNEANTRTYWMQAGVGVVQWAFQATNNVTFTLLATNLDPGWAVPPPPPSEEDAGAR